MALGSHCSLIGLLSRKALCVCVCKEFVVTVKFQSLLVSRNLGVYASRSFKGASRDQQSCLGTSKIIFSSMVYA